MRPSSSVVAVRLSRGTDRFVVPVQLPAAVLADEASGVAAIASIAQIADAADFVLAMTPLSLAMNENERRA
jgi:hypothetical protein